MRRLISACAAAAVILCACGSPNPSSPHASPSPAASPPSARSSSAAPDIQQLDVVASGVGAFNLVAVPVAILHSRASRLMADGVVVHFTLSRRGATLFSLTSEAVILYPGQTLAVTANCTDTCDGADGVTQSVTVAAWKAADGAAITVGDATYTCGGACKGHGYGDVAATIHGEALRQGAALHVFASCGTGPSTIVGGGQRSLIWPQPGGTVNLDVPVIISAQPTACQVNVTPVSGAATP